MWSFLITCAVTLLVLGIVYLETKCFFVFVDSTFCTFFSYIKRPDCMISYTSSEPYILISLHFFAFQITSWFSCTSYVMPYERLGGPEDGSPSSGTPASAAPVAPPFLTTNAAGTNASPVVLYSAPDNSHEVRERERERERGRERGEREWEIGVRQERQR